MNKYFITFDVPEHSSITVTVEADSETEAIQKAPAALEKSIYAEFVAHATPIDCIQVAE